jgi:hypothetical protein
VLRHGAAFWSIGEPQLAFQADIILVIGVAILFAV